MPVVVAGPVAVVPVVAVVPAAADAARTVAVLDPTSLLLPSLSMQTRVIHPVSAWIRVGFARHPNIRE